VGFTDTSLDIVVTFQRFRIYQYPAKYDYLYYLGLGGTLSPTISKVICNCAIGGCSGKLSSPKLLAIECNETASTGNTPLDASWFGIVKRSNMVVSSKGKGSNDYTLIP
jgi:hypothetical protein